MLMAAFAALTAVSACGGAQPPAQQPPSASAPASAPAAATPAARVYFVEPKDGASVKSPVHLVFGIEGYQLAPVPAGTITARTSR